jgi:WD40 repeat protein/tRNA A-37 threonylcarbamoyl transferase component Bud32
MSQERSLTGLSTRSLVSLLVADQRQRWRHGERALVEAYLRQHPDLGAEDRALLELVHNEIILRKECGETPQPEEYQQRFPTLSSQVREVFAIDGLFDSTPRGSEGAPGRGVPSITGSSLPGRTLGPYQLLEVLGRGGMGQVYKARHQGLDRLVALKVIRQDYVDEDHAGARFAQEAQAAARLSHPHIVTLFDAGEIDGTPFLAMEYLEGIDLDRLVRRDGPLPVARACAYLRQAALGLQHAQERGLVHRDVKPANLFLTADGTVVKVLDFGLARFRSGSQVGSLTQAGQFLGTPDYLAPEQLTDSRQVDGRADVYSLGCTACYLLTGDPPFPGGSVWDKLFKHRQTEPAMLRSPPKGVPPALGAVLRRMLAKRPDQRWPTPGDVAAALAPFCGPEGTGRVLGATATRRPSRPRMVVLLALGVAALVGLVGLVILVANLAWPPGQGANATGERQEGTGDRKGDTPKDAPPGQTKGPGKNATAAVPTITFLHNCQRLGADGGEAHSGGVDSVVFCPDGLHALSGGTDGALRLWEVATGKEVPRFRTIKHGEQVAVAPDGQSVLFGGYDGSVGMCLFATGEVRWHNRNRTGRIGAVAVAPKAQIVLAGGMDREDPTLRLYEQRTGKELFTFPEAREPIRAIAFAPQGDLMVCSGGGYLQGDRWTGADFTIRLWDVALRKELKPLKGHTDTVGCLAFTPNGRYVLSGSRDGTIRLWEVSSGRELTRQPVPEKGARSLAIAPGGRWALSGSDDGQVRLWRLPLSAEGDFVPGGLEEVRVLQVPGGASQNRPAHGGLVMTVAFSPNGRLALTGSRDGLLRLWQIGEP